jgi:hypothetical protein
MRSRSVSVLRKAAPRGNHTPLPPCGQVTACGLAVWALVKLVRQPKFDTWVPSARVHSLESTALSSRPNVPASVSHWSL